VNALLNNCADKVGRRLSDSVFLSRLDILILLAVALLGVTKLILPFSNDQAVATLAAVGMRDGAVLYRDLWDVRQPGIFYFFLVGGSLFGFNEVGIHLFELIYMLIFSLILLIALKDQFDNPAIASVVPLFTVGMYYAVSGDWHLTQPESVMAPPAFLSLWFGLKSLQSRGGHRILWLFLSGLMAGLVLIFKLLFLLIVAGFWVTLVYKAVLLKDRRPVATLFNIALPLGAGVAVPLLLMFGHFAYAGVLNLVIWTFFQYPTIAAKEWPLFSRIDVLINGVSWFIANFAPLMALSAIGAYATWRSYITVNLTLWVSLALLVIVLQPLSWWQYHFMLLFVPLGILAAHGVDALWPRLNRLASPAMRWQSPFIALISLVLLFSPTLSGLAIKTMLLARNGFLTKEDRLRYQSDFNNDYRVALKETAFLREPGSQPGKVFVLGDVLYYYLSGRDPAIPFLNAAGYSPPELWEQIVKSLYQTRPAYIFLPRNKLTAVRKYTPRAARSIADAARFIDENYDIARASDTGTWYVIKHTLSAAR
jgi:hypothetical protein